MASGGCAAAERTLAIRKRLATATTFMKVRRIDPRSFLLCTLLSHLCFKSGSPSHAQASGTSPPRLHVETDTTHCRASLPIAARGPSVGCRPPFFLPGGTARQSRAGPARVVAPCASCGPADMRRKRPSTIGAPAHCGNDPEHVSFPYSSPCENPGGEQGPRFPSRPPVPPPLHVGVLAGCLPPGLQCGGVLPR